MIKLIGVNVMPFLGNLPEVWLQVDEFSDFKDAVYTKSGSYYWTQGANGLTHFLSHRGEPYTNQSLPYYDTLNAGGFGGARFTLKVNGFDKPVRLVGPWSGNSECANELLPKSVMEVTFRDGKGSLRGGCLTIDVINELLGDTGWQVVLNKTRPRLEFHGMSKDRMSQTTLVMLQNRFEKAKG